VLARITNGIPIVAKFTIRVGGVQFYSIYLSEKIILLFFAKIGISYYVYVVALYYIYTVS